MKKIILATSALAALAVASPAMAGTDDPQLQLFVVNGKVTPRCDITAGTNVVTLDAESIADTQGFADAGLSGKIAAKLTALNTTAWCTGTKNAVNLTRTGLSNGIGTPVNGFRRSVVYDINVNIAGATRLGGGAVAEGTSDGLGNGPGIGIGAGVPVSAFGPSGTGAAVTFTQEPGSTVQAADFAVPSLQLKRSDFTTSTNRLLAGNYTGLVSLIIIPGI